MGDLCDCKACRIRNAALVMVDAATDSGDDMVPPMLGLLQAAVTLAARYTAESDEATKEGLRGTVGEMYNEAIMERWQEKRAVN